jgi:hypothetical protein
MRIRIKQRKRKARPVLWLALGLAIMIGAGYALAETFSGNVRIMPVWSHTKTNVTTVSEAFAYALYTFTHTSGTNANQMNQLWHQSVAFVAGGTNTYDLAGGITNAFGTTLTMAKVRFLYIEAATTNGSTLTIGNHANAFSSWLGATNQTAKIRPGGALMLVGPDAAAYAVGAGSTDILKLVNDDGSAGASATVYVGAADN